MRITPDLVAQSPQFTNPLNDREIKLRAYKIPAVENLGATQDQFDVIDLSDNEIRKLEVRRPPQQPPLPAPAGYPPRCAPAGAYAFRVGIAFVSNLTPRACCPAHCPRERIAAACVQLCINLSASGCILDDRLSRSACACVSTLGPRPIMMLTGVPASHLHRGFPVFLSA